MLQPWYKYIYIHRFRFVVYSGLAQARPEVLYDKNISKDSYGTKISPTARITLKEVEGGVSERLSNVFLLKHFPSLIVNHS
jgi:hypothetical protein